MSIDVAERLLAAVSDDRTDAWVTIEAEIPARWGWQGDAALVPATWRAVPVRAALGGRQRGQVVILD